MRTLSPVLHTRGPVDGKTLPFMVSTLKSVISRVFGRAVPDRDVPFAEHDREVPVHLIVRRRVARVDDEHADQAHAHLRHLVVVGVVHERAVLPSVNSYLAVSPGLM